MERPDERSDARERALYLLYEAHSKGIAPVDTSAGFRYPRLARSPATGIGFRSTDFILEGTRCGAFPRR
jgi:hypothetical protein